MTENSNGEQPRPRGHGYWAGASSSGRDPLQPFGQSATPPATRQERRRGRPWWILALALGLVAALLGTLLVIDQRRRAPQQDPAAAVTPATTASPTAGASRAASPAPSGSTSPGAPGSAAPTSAAPSVSSSPAPTSPAPVTSRAARTSIPFSSPEDDAEGTFEIVKSEWTPRGLWLTVRVELTRGQMRLGFFALDNGPTASQYDASPTDQTYLEGQTITAGQTLQGTVLFEKERGDTTVFLSGSRGRQVAALLVEG